MWLTTTHNTKDLHFTNHLTPKTLGLGPPLPTSTGVGEKIIPNVVGEKENKRKP